MVNRVPLSPAVLADILYLVSVLGGAATREDPITRGGAIGSNLLRVQPSIAPMLDGLHRDVGAYPPPRELLIHTGPASPDDRLRPVLRRLDEHMPHHRWRGFGQGDLVTLGAGPRKCGVHGPPKPGERHGRRAHGALDGSPGSPGHLGAGAAPMLQYVVSITCDVAGKVVVGHLPLSPQITKGGAALRGMLPPRRRLPDRLRELHGHGDFHGRRRHPVQEMHGRQRTAARPGPQGLGGNAPQLDEL